MKDLFAKYQPSQRPKLDIGPDDTALFQYSGGTTGISKGAMALHRNVVANTLQIKEWITTAEAGKEIVLMAIPLFHVYGMVAGMCYALAIGASMVMIPNARDIPDVLENIHKYHPTIFPGVPTLYNAINNRPEVKAGKVNLRSIKACISGSAALMRETKEKFEELSGGKVFEGYGLSEAPTATHCNPLMGVNKTGSIGMPFPDVDCKIISLDDGETEMQMGEIGELAINGPQVMKGYHNMPTETANALRKLSDGKVWLFTGDIARMDEEGYFYIVDRKKELIKPGGIPSLAARKWKKPSPRIRKFWKSVWQAFLTRIAARRSKRGSCSSRVKPRPPMKSKPFARNDWPRIKSQRIMNLEKNCRRQPSEKFCGVSWRNSIKKRKV